jgi:hypothetical protein
MRPQLTGLHFSRCDGGRAALARWLFRCHIGRNILRHAGLSGHNNRNSRPPRIVEDKGKRFTKN